MPGLILIFLAAFAAVAGNALDTAHPADPLVWEKTTVIHTAKPGEVAAHFVFNVKNSSADEVVIQELKAACGCTFAEMPGHPWRLKPQESGKFEGVINLRDTIGFFPPPGQYPKEIQVIRPRTTNTLMVVVVVPPGMTNGLTQKEMDRLWGQQLAAVDHQAIFKNDCATCHLKPALGPSGERLYHVACGICHEAAHRAAIVPDLHTMKLPGDTNYWRTIVTSGKPGTLMPGFAATLGGPLDDAQINSLVEYLPKAFPQPPAPVSTNAAK